MSANVEATEVLATTDDVTMNFSGLDVRMLKNVNDDEVWFCVKDVCQILGLNNNSQAISRLEDGVISTYPIIDRLGREQKATFVNEDGLYDLILDSRKPEAKAFRKWVTGTVLPSIRKSGGYICNQENMSPAEILANAMLVAQKVIDNQRLELTKKTAELAIAEGVIEAKDEIIAENAEKVTAYTQFIENEGLVSMTDAAKALNLPPRKFIESLRKCEYITQKNIPTQRAINTGYMVAKFVSTFSGRNIPQAMVTRKGLDYFMKNIEKIKFVISKL